MVLGNLGSPDAQGPLDPFPPETRTLNFFFFFFKFSEQSAFSYGKSPR